jgi:hypothetical protein
MRGLTAGPRPLYSARFATSAFRLAVKCPCGGIGRRARLKIEFRKECWFDSGQGHQNLFFLSCHAMTSRRQRHAQALFRLPDEALNFRAHSRLYNASNLPLPALTRLPGGGKNHHVRQGK